MKQKPQKWLVTGAAGFIGSHLIEKLLNLDQRVVGFDNFSTGKKDNLEFVKKAVGDKSNNFEFIEGDIRNLEECTRACSGVDSILHQAALGSVPRSIEDPLTTHNVNVTGFINMLLAARDSNIKRVVYASSSSVYGDSQELPKVEDRIGKQLSPYAVSKYSNETYAHAFSLAYGLELIGLRYFNVFGPRQDPEGQYAAVIPRWYSTLLSGEKCKIFGDGETSRDFCYVNNVVQANILAALTKEQSAINQVYNVAVGGRTTLNELYEAIVMSVSAQKPEIKDFKPVYEDFRAGDVRHSHADISKAKSLLDYNPEFDIKSGLSMAAEWYIKNCT